MSYTLIFTNSYNKRANRFAKSHPGLKQPYRKALQLLAHDPYHPSLRIHALKGKLAALHSVSINVSYRITLEMVITDKEIILINVGSHDGVCQP